MNLKLFIPATLALMLAGCSAGRLETTFAPDPGPQNEFLAQIDQLLPGMGAEQIMDRQDAQLAFERICFENSGPGKHKEQAALCRAMMQRVGPDVALPARIWLLRKVEPIGRDEVVPTLAGLIRDENEQIRETARRALQNNPSAQAGAVLRNELKTAANPLQREAVLNSLAFRRDEAAVGLIADCLNDAEPAVVNAAVAALGEIANRPAVRILLAQLSKAAPQTGDLVVDACLRAAERMHAAGDSRGAIEIYETVRKSSNAESIQMAAIRGITTAKGADAMPMLIELITGDNVRMQLVAADYARHVPGPKATAQITDALDTASPAAQAVLLNMLGQRGDATSMSTVVSYVNTGEERVRIAALAALRTVGNGTQVEMLAKRAAASTGPERDAARHSLNGMRGLDVDEAIMLLIPNAQDRVKAELVRAASVRFMKPAYEYMLAYTADSDESVRVSAITGVGQLATIKDLPIVLKALAQASGDQTFVAGQEALVHICSQTVDSEEQTGPLIEAMASAEPAALAIAIGALGKLKGENALVAVRAGLKSEHEVVQKAAMDSLAGWGPLLCMNWVYAGPYRKEGTKAEDLFDMPFPPEDAQATDVEWKPLKKVRGKDMPLDQIDRGENCCAYLKTKIASKTAQDVVMMFGSDDGIKVWLNGEVINAKNVERRLKMDEDQVLARLNSGENTLLIKVTQKDNDWIVTFGIKAPEDGPPPGVTCDEQ